MNTLESILNSVAQPENIIIIDDLSSDSTLELLEKFRKRQKNVLLRQNTLNRGQSYSRNLAATLSNADFLIFQDDDDLCSESRFAEHIRMHAEGSDVTYVSSIKYYPSGYSVLHRNFNFGPKAIDVNTLTAHLLLGHKTYLTPNSIPASTLSVKRDVFLRTGGFNVDYRRLEDVDFAIRLSLSNYKFSWSSEVGVYRFHTSGTDKGSGLDMLFEEKLLNQYVDYISKFQFYLAKAHCEIRKLYFQGKYNSILLKMFSNPIYAFNSLGRVNRAMKRMLHDFRINRN